jgi:hypothetical protein
MSSRRFVPTMYPLVDPKTGLITAPWQRYQQEITSDLTPGGINEVLTSSGVSLAWAKIGNANIDSAAAIAYSKLNLAASIVNADIAGAAAIGWAKISKTGSSIADLATRSATNVDSGTLPQAQKWTQAITTSTGNQDNFNFSSADSLLCNNAAPLVFRGLLAGVAGQQFRLLVRNSTVTLNHQDANSSAANRIITATGAALAITRFADLEYEGNASRWVMAGYA